MTVTNRVLRDTVDLRVDKTVTGAVGGYTGIGTDFTVGYTCYLVDPADGFSGSLDIAAGAAAGDPGRRRPRRLDLPRRGGVAVAGPAPGPLPTPGARRTSPGSTPRAT